MGVAAGAKTGVELLTKKLENGVQSDAGVEQAITAAVVGSAPASIASARSALGGGPLSPMKFSARKEITYPRTPAEWPGATFFARLIHIRITSDISKLDATSLVWKRRACSTHW